MPWRTLPGAHPTRGAYFTRGTSRDRYARYTEEAAPYVDNMERLLQQVRDGAGARFRGRSSSAPRRRASRASSITGRPRAAMDEALDLLAEQGVAVDALRIRAFPLGEEVAEFVDEHETCSSSSRTATRRCAR